MRFQEGHFPIDQRKSCWDNAEKVLNVNGSADANASYVRIGGKPKVRVSHGGEGERSEGIRLAMGGLSSGW